MSTSYIAELEKVKPELKEIIDILKTEYTTVYNCSYKILRFEKLFKENFIVNLYIYKNKYYEIILSKNNVDYTVKDTFLIINPSKL